MDRASGSTQNARRAIAILNVGFMHDETDEVSLRVGDDMSLAALDLLAGVEAARPPAFRRLHDWLSMTPASGLLLVPPSRAPP